MGGCRTPEHRGRDRCAKRAGRPRGASGDPYGCDNAAELVERAAGVSHATARARLRTARAITARTTITGQDRPAPLDRARHELASGRLGVDAATTIVDALRPLQRRVGVDAVAAAEAELVRAAVGAAGEPPCGIHELRIMAQTWALYLDPDGTLPDDDSERFRTFRVGRERDSLFPIHGNVTAEVAAGLVRLLDSHLNPRVGERGPRFFGATGSSDASGAVSPDDGLPGDENVRDPRCIIPGCRVRAAWCEVHHVVEHARGGPTDVGNGVLLCWHHHRTIETSGWQIRMRDGTPEIQPPAWIDPRRRWRPPNRVLHHELARARSA
ncbi:HNH endonuclease signature motif containing protein [Microbacterium kyungheense]|uniref:HNH endonuclease n=1 Tax=Microbacterium kyungheense TaxID=1263636 RepID=A0A543EU07_9MICO|nr:HNH endonuclease signature motif containing protein [Microbacterium kyungheense]TQM25067.1 HNH endonuclease [Microbacterium kyungheense]